VGGFVVNIAPLPPPPPPALKAEIAIAMVDGNWQATVSFENTGNWFQTDWGAVKIEGISFLTFPKLTPLPGGSLAPIPASFSHVYELGELKPGAYLFVFRSSAGHAARASVDVAGVEPPTPFEQWKFNALGSAYLEIGASGDLDDPHGNGISTLVEFALGGDPSKGAQPEIIRENGVSKLALKFRRPAGSRAGADCLIEVSKDMKSWSPAGDAVEIRPSVFDIDGSESISACQKLPVGISKWPFMRIRVAKAAAN